MDDRSMNVNESQSWIPGFPEKDARVEGWFLMGSPVPLVSILIGYVSFVKFIGPTLMKDAKPFELRRFILFYNASMVIANLSIASFIYYYAYYDGPLTIWLVAPDLGTDPRQLLLLGASWFYLILRLAECVETILFVLRKRFRQVSTLHVFHHVSVVLSVYLYTTYGGFVLAGFEVIFNGLIHVIMYSYYFLAACGPSVQKYLWWKKYLTKLQIAQFVIMIARNIHLAIWLGNKYSWLPGFMLLQCFIFFVQFSHFYIQSYRQKRVELGREGPAGKADSNNNSGVSGKKLN